MVRVPPEPQGSAPAEPVSSRQRLQRREAAVLAAARQLGEEAGCLAVRMADLSKEAGISIGSLYRHFESKEDVIVGLACEALRRRLGEFEEACASTDMGAAERLIAAVIGDARFSLAHPTLFGAEELGATRAIRLRASPRRVDELDRLDRRLGETVLEATRAAAAAGAFLPSRDVERQTRTISQAVRTLMAGSSRTAIAPVLSEGGPVASQPLPPHFLDVCAATFAGLDWRVPYPRDAVERVARASSSA